MVIEVEPYMSFHVINWLIAVNAHPYVRAENILRIAQLGLDMTLTFNFL